jgi:Staphylococcal nuclease homologue
LWIVEPVTPAAFPPSSAAARGDVDRRPPARWRRVRCRRLRRPCCSRRRAQAFLTTRFLGKTVTLAFDQQRRDRYGRTLAYVCLDGRSVNETIIREGYGFAYVKYPFRADLMARFPAAERAARAAGLGLWAPAAETP